MYIKELLKRLEETRLLGIPYRVKQQPNFLCRINAKSSKRIQEPQPRFFRSESMYYSFGHG